MTAGDQSLHEVTVDQIRNILLREKDEKTISNAFLQGITETMLVLYHALNRDKEGIPHIFSVRDFYARYLQDIDGLLRDAQRIQFVQSNAEAYDQRAIWVRDVVWPRLNEREKNHVTERVNLVMAEARHLDTLRNAVRKIRGLVNLLMSDVH